MRAADAERMKNKAFTLIELLVVIAVVAMLMALLFPALSRVRKQARAVACRANLKQWGVALATYIQDSEGRLPCDIAGSGSVWFLRGAFLRTDDPNAPQDTLHRFATRDIACCPMATKPRRTATFITESFWGDETVTITGSAGKTFDAWQITSPAPAFHGSYGFNGWLFHWYSERVPLTGWGLPADLNVFALQGAARIPVLLDATFMWDRPGAFDPPPRREVASRLGIKTFCIDRHRGYINGLFLDWSVRRIGLKELWSLSWSQDFDTAGPWTKAGGVLPEDWPEWMQGLRDY